MNFKILFDWISVFASPVSLSKFRSNSVTERAQLSQYTVHEFNFSIIINERKKTTSCSANKLMFLSGPVCSPTDRRMLTF